MRAPHLRSTAAALILIISGTMAGAVVEPDVAQTKHNLSVSGPGEVKAQSESQICVFCHTPHGAEKFPGSPLWNRKLSGATYTPNVYSSSSLDAEAILGTTLAEPAGSSKLCLSCHDGTLALGAVNVLNGAVDVNVPMVGTDPDGSMPGGPHTAASGFTRDLGVDLRNDHPISLTYDTALADADGELHTPDSNQMIPAGTGETVAIRTPAHKPLLPLEATGATAEGQIQCGTCHDPHLYDTTGADIKFLRAHRLQQGPPAGGAFDPNNDIICIACHDKGQTWALSAHANPQIADEQYKTAAADLRDFTSGVRVWQAACLNCHDTHAVQGTRRLVREGTDDINEPKRGGQSAIEESCYQCHTTDPDSILTNNTAVPDIESDFALPRHMPVSNVDQAAGEERHDIGTGTDINEGTQRGKDFIEDDALLGKGGTGNLANRHAECTDCHNPHRVTRNRLFNGNAASPDPAGTHDHAAAHSNLASGVLRGTWGVEPVYGSESFLSLPTSFLIKRGDAGNGASTDVTSGHVTREYQICLKCHSDYGFDDTGAYPSGGRPSVGTAGGSTPLGTNGLTQYTNQAMEFQGPVSQQGEVQGVTGTGAGAAFEGQPHFNHRSWHPVIAPTDRDLGDRNASAGAWLAPWSSAVGTQTMYCSDCHGSDTDADTVVPQGGENGNSWGPHGSTNDFILKGQWDDRTGHNSDRTDNTADPNNGLCFKCHDYQTYVDRDGNGNNSGFGNNDEPNLHAVHADRIGAMRCTWCHAAVPHGFKNKALLVNLNDVGPEAGNAVPVEIPIGGSGAVYNQEPYYLNAKLKVLTFAQSGQWQESHCGSASNNPSQGRDWMKDVCETPP